MFLKRFVLDLDGCEHYPPVNFRWRAQSGLLTAGLQTSDSCNARSFAAELSGKLEADALTLALLVYCTCGVGEKSSARLLT
jgi:hypothetical protein